MTELVNSVEYKTMEGIVSEIKYPFQDSGKREIRSKRTILSDTSDISKSSPTVSVRPLKSKIVKIEPTHIRFTPSPAPKKRVLVRKQCIMPVQLHHEFELPIANDPVSPRKRIIKISPITNAEMKNSRMESPPLPAKTVQKESTNIQKQLKLEKLQRLMQDRNQTIKLPSKDVIEPIIEPVPQIDNSQWKKEIQQFMSQKSRQKKREQEEAKKRDAELKRKIEMELTKLELQRKTNMEQRIRRKQTASAKAEKERLLKEAQLERERQKEALIEQERLKRKAILEQRKRQKSEPIETNETHLNSKTIEMQKENEPDNLPAQSKPFNSEFEPKVTLNQSEVFSIDIPDADIDQKRSTEENSVIESNSKLVDVSKLASRVQNIANLVSGLDKQLRKVDVNRFKLNSQSQNSVGSLVVEKPASNVTMNTKPLSDSENRPDLPGIMSMNEIAENQKIEEVRTKAAYLIQRRYKIYKHNKAKKNNMAKKYKLAKSDWQDRQTAKKYQATVTENFNEIAKNQEKIKLIYENFMGAVNNRSGIKNIVGKSDIELFMNSINKEMKDNGPSLSDTSSVAETEKPADPLSMISLFAKKLKDGKLKTGVEKAAAHAETATQTILNEELKISNPVIPPQQYQEQVIETTVNAGNLDLESIDTSSYSVQYNISEISSSLGDISKSEQIQPVLSNTQEDQPYITNSPPTLNNPRLSLDLHIDGEIKKDVETSESKTPKAPESPQPDNKGAYYRRSTPQYRKFLMGQEGPGRLAPSSLSRVFEKQLQQMIAIQDATVQVAELSNNRRDAYSKLEIEGLIKVYDEQKRSNEIALEEAINNRVKLMEVNNIKPLPKRHKSPEPPKKEPSELDILLKKGLNFENKDALEKISAPQSPIPEKNPIYIPRPLSPVFKAEFSFKRDDSYSRRIKELIGSCDSSLSEEYLISETIEAKSGVANYDEDSFESISEDKKSLSRSNSSESFDLELEKARKHVEKVKNKFNLEIKLRNSRKEIESLLKEKKIVLHLSERLKLEKARQRKLLDDIFHLEPEPMNDLKELDLSSSEDQNNSWNRQEYFENISSIEKKFEIVAEKSVNDNYSLDFEEISEGSEYILAKEIAPQLADSDVNKPVKADRVSVKVKSEPHDNENTAVAASMISNNESIENIEELIQEEIIPNIKIDGKKSSEDDLSIEKSIAISSVKLQEGRQKILEAYEGEVKEVIVETEGSNKESELESDYGCQSDSLSNHAADEQHGKLVESVSSEINLELETKDFSEEIEESIVEELETKEEGKDDTTFEKYDNESQSEFENEYQNDFEEEEDIRAIGDVETYVQPAASNEPELPDLNSNVELESNDISEEIEVPVAEEIGQKIKTVDEIKETILNNTKSPFNLCDAAKDETIIDFITNSIVNELVKDGAVYLTTFENHGFIDQEIQQNIMEPPKTTWNSLPYQQRFELYLDMAISRKLDNNDISLVEDPEVEILVQDLLKEATEQFQKSNHSNPASYDTKSPLDANLANGNVKKILQKWKTYGNTHGKKMEPLLCVLVRERGREVCNFTTVRSDIQDQIADEIFEHLIEDTVRTLQNTYSLIENSNQ